jgi:hypothetical protein
MVNPHAAIKTTAATTAANWSNEALIFIAVILLILAGAVSLKKCGLRPGSRFVCGVSKIGADQDHSTD